MFNGNFKESSSNVISIQEISAETMEMILYAIYTSRIRFLPGNVYLILKASHLFQMDVIFNACVNCIMSNTIHIHYLIETCLFAKTAELQKLYDNCIKGIAADFLHWGKTDSFLDPPFEAVKDMLSNVSSVSSFQDDDLLATIIKWCKHNHASARDVKVLFQTPKFSTKSFGSSVIAELVVNPGSSFSSSEANNENTDDKLQSNYNLNINAYFYGVDVKTGANGWGTLKLNDSFDMYTLSNFRSAESSYRRICSIGTKIYCFEWNRLKKKFCFHYFEGADEVALEIPEYFTRDNEGYCFNITAVENEIYLFSSLINANIWVYNCELNQWKHKKLNDANRGYSESTVYKFSPLFASTSLDRALYVIGCKVNNQGSIVKIDTRTNEHNNCTTFRIPVKHEKAAVCAFDGKIAISGSDHSGTLHNTFSIFDVTAGQWRTDLKPMNDGRARHKLIHHDGFIYTLDYSPFIKNEKYDVRLNTWIEMPSLPKRVQIVNADSVKLTIGCTQIFHVDVDC